jgi:hypothetical protein
LDWVIDLDDTVAVNRDAIKHIKSVSGVKDVIDEVHIGKVQHKQVELEEVSGRGPADA